MLHYLAINPNIPKLERIFLGIDNTLCNIDICMSRIMSSINNYGDVADTVKIVGDAMLSGNLDSDMYNSVMLLWTNIIIYIYHYYLYEDMLLPITKLGILHDYVYVVDSR